RLRDRQGAERDDRRPLLQHQANAEPAVGVRDSPLATSGPSVIPQASGARPSARAVRLLLPVWGYRYVRQFLEFSLPTMLAPGNVPALAGLLPCTFVLLTSSADADA